MFTTWTERKSKTIENMKEMEIVWVTWQEILQQQTWILHDKLSNKGYFWPIIAKTSTKHFYRLLVLVSYGCVSSRDRKRPSWKWQNLMTRVCVCVVVVAKTTHGNIVKQKWVPSQCPCCISFRNTKQNKNKRSCTHVSPDTCWAPPVNPYLSTWLSSGTALPFGSRSELALPLSVSVSAALLRNCCSPLTCSVFAIYSTFISLNYSHQALHCGTAVRQTLKPPMKTQRSAGWPKRRAAASSGC